MKPDITKIGANRSTAWSISAATPTTHVSPATNTNGLTIRTIAQYSQYVLITSVGTSAPTAYNDTSVTMILTTEPTGAAQITKEIFVPAGLGVYSIASTSGANGCTVTYDLH